MLFEAYFRASTLGHSASTRYPRRGRLTRLGPPKRTSRLSSDSMENPSEIDTPPEAENPVSFLSTIPSSGTDEVKGLRALLHHQHHAISNGQYTPPASQTPPPSQISQDIRLSPETYVREQRPSSYHRETTPPVVREASPRNTPNDERRRVSSSSTSSSSGSTRTSSASRTLGRSSLRNLLASTAQVKQQQPIDVALETVQKGLEALSVRKQDDSNRPIIVCTVKYATDVESHSPLCFWKECILWYSITSNTK